MRSWPSILIVAVSVALAGCRGGAAPVPAAESRLTVSVAQAVPAQGTGSIAITGTVRLKRETTLAFSTAGRIAAITVREGDSVRAGQVLARLDPTSLGAASASARAEAARADADLRRLAALAAKGWVTAPRVESARAAAAAARARVDQTGFDLRLGVITAPAAGSILRRPVEPGQVVAAGTAVLVLGETASGYVLRVPLADADMARVARGQLAVVSIPALGSVPLAARISEIGARSDDATGTFRIELALPPRDGLRSGLIGSARLRLGGIGAAGGAVSVPASAVFAARADEGFVYVYEAANSLVRRRQVALGPLGDASLDITSGLQPGEQVVVSGADRLRDGLRVTVRR